MFWTPGCWTRIQNFYIPNKYCRLETIKRLKLVQWIQWIIPGTVPSSLCDLGYESPLEDLLISGNEFTGNLDLGWCNNLVFIDAQRNKVIYLKYDHVLCIYTFVLISCYPLAQVLWRASWHKGVPVTSHCPSCTQQLQWNYSSWLHHRIFINYWSQHGEQSVSIWNGTF